MQELAKIFVEVPVGACENSSHYCFSIIIVFLDPSDKVIGKWFNGLEASFSFCVYLCLHPCRYGLYKSQGETVLSFPGEFCSPQDCRGSGYICISPLNKRRISLGPPSYSPGIE